jgi:hypothetical protein
MNLRRNRSLDPGSNESADPSVGRPKKSSIDSSPTPTTARTRSSRRNRTSATSSPSITSAVISQTRSRSNS